MSKIVRKQQNIFGSSAGGTGITEYGSPAGGTPVYSTDLDAIQTSEWATGWSAAALAGSEIPTFQDFNAIHFVATSQIGYLLQEGVAEYLSTTEYHQNSIVKKAGTYELYGSKINTNTGNALPVAVDDASWEFLGDLSNLSITNQLPVGSIYQNYNDGTNPATLLGYGTWVQLQDSMLIGAGGTYAAGVSGGSATTTQTTTTLAAHNHAIITTDNGAQTVTSGGETAMDDIVSSKSTSTTGSGAAMTTISPYTGVYIWYRSA